MIIMIPFIVFVNAVLYPCSHHFLTVGLGISIAAALIKNYDNDDNDDNNQ